MDDLILYRESIYLKVGLVTNRTLSFGKFLPYAVVNGIFVSFYTTKGRQCNATDVTPILFTSASSLACARNTKITTTIPKFFLYASDYGLMILIILISTLLVYGIDRISLRLLLLLLLLTHILMLLVII